MKATRYVSCCVVMMSIAGAELLAAERSSLFIGDNYSVDRALVAAIRSNKLLVVVHFAGDFSADRIESMDAQSLQQFQQLVLTSELRRWIERHAVMAITQIGPSKLALNAGDVPPLSRLSAKQVAKDDTIVYFCTADGRVLHFLVGAITGDYFRKEAT